MKQVSIVRPLKPSDEGTFSTLKFGDVSIHCLELPWRSNRPLVSCIPIGTYRCEVKHSPKHDADVYWVLDVPARSAIEIHSANFGGDEHKGFQAQLLGCIAPCMSFGYLINTHNKPQLAGLDSRKAVAMLMAWAQNQPFQLTVTQEPEA